MVHLVHHLDLERDFTLLVQHFLQQDSITGCDPFCQICNSHFRQIQGEDKCKTWKFQRRKTHPVVRLSHELFEEAVKGEVQVRPQLLQQLGNLRQQSYQTSLRLKSLNHNVHKNFGS